MSSFETEELSSFRQEVRRTCQAMLPSDIRTKVHLGLPLDKTEFLLWERLLAARGWLVGHWPIEFGGQAWCPLKRYIFTEESTRVGAPRVAPFGINYVGPVIYTYGSAEQKARFLPGIRNSETWWCQGYSEPGAGSDLAALSTRAVLDGDHYRVTGQKTWTTKAQWADMMFGLVRTAQLQKRQDGITFLLIDMKAPGVNVRPITTLDACQEVNEVFLDDVRVPIANRIGEEGKGWRYGKFLLANERMTTIGAVGRAKDMLAGLMSLSQRTLECGRPVAQIPSFRRRLAELQIALLALEACCVGLLARQPTGMAGNASGSILKLRSTHITQAIARCSAELLMRSGLPYEHDALTSLSASHLESTGLLRTHLIGRASTIYGGATEVQKDIIAKAALGF
jgi:alkylation response protein AidB-like acyl-CoA dehydrogenase